MLQPKKTKFRKQFKGRISGDAKGGTTLNFGSYGLKAMEPERIHARPIAAARRAGPRPRTRLVRCWWGAAGRRGPWQADKTLGG